MSNVGLFLVGTGVTLIVLSALALLIWGAVMDGQYEEEQKHEAEEAAVRAPQEPVPALHALDVG